MRHFFVILLGACLALAGCLAGDRATTVKDVTRAETIILKKKPSQGAIHAISISGFGSINGDAEVQLILHGAVYKKEKISGSFRVEFDGDWYADEAELRYIPTKVSSGNLTVKYAFRD
jgi:hypothetical protein